MGAGTPAGVALQAIRTFGLNHLTAGVIQQLRQRLPSDARTGLKKLAHHAPQWMASAIDAVIRPTAGSAQPSFREAAARLKLGTTTIVERDFWGLLDASKNLLACDAAGTSLQRWNRSESIQGIWDAVVVRKVTFNNR